MNVRKWIGIVLLAAGLLALAYGGFTYTQERHATELGPIELEYREKDRVEIPSWAGVAAVVAGIVLLVWKR